MTGVGYFEKKKVFSKKVIFRYNLRYVVVSYSERVEDDTPRNSRVFRVKVDDCLTLPKSSHVYTRRFVDSFL